MMVGTSSDHWLVMVRGHGGSRSKACGRLAPGYSDLAVSNKTNSGGILPPRPSRTNRLRPLEASQANQELAGIEGSKENPILIDPDDVSLSEEATEICTSQESFDGSPEKPIRILDEASVCESLESQTEDNAAVRCPNSSLLDPVGTPKDNMEEPRSESECGMECSLAEMRAAITRAFDSSELPVYYLEESRLCESPESNWQGTIPVGSPHISTVNPICVPEGSVEVKPQTDHGIVMDSALPQTESAARPASRSPELLIREPEVPALVDVSVQTETPLREERRYVHGMRYNQRFETSD
ncbi:hypothetical protein CNMCM5878_009885 [Aspergillus fumigatiaffinis]|nr:hypothetical protein CNMCM5878_009885 [Aspergillus fumigatiaffinis]